jgi:hypothetical protein
MNFDGPLQSTSIKFLFTDPCSDLIIVLRGRLRSRRGRMTFLFNVLLGPIVWATGLVFWALLLIADHLRRPIIAHN